MDMNILPTDFTIIPKDCSQFGVPMLACDKKGNTVCKDAPALAMAYFPTQQFRDLYDLNYALQVGTIFKELDLPFYGIGGCLL